MRVGPYAQFEITKTIKCEFCSLGSTSDNAFNAQNTPNRQGCRIFSATCLRLVEIVGEGGFKPPTPLHMVHPAGVEPTTN